MKKGAARISENAAISQPSRALPRTLALALMRLAARLPLRVLHGVGVALGWIMYCSPAYRRHLRQNLALAGYTDARLRRAAIAEAGKMLAEVPKVLLGPREETLALVREYVGREHVEQARAAGKGVVFLTPHFGCFELVAQAVDAPQPLTALYRPPKMAWLKPLVEDGRARHNVRVAPADFGGVRDLLAALKRREAILMLPDQVPGRGDGAWVDFFGAPAYTMTLAARLSGRQNSVCLVATGERLARGSGFALRVRPLPAALPGESASRRVNRALEEAIRARPEQYLWGYNRYKTPRGAARRDG